MKQLYELMYDEDGRKLLGPGGAISSVGTPDTGSLISILQSTPSRWETLDNSSGTLPYQTSRFTWLMNPSTVSKTLPSVFSWAFHWNSSIVS